MLLKLCWIGTEYYRLTATGRAVGAAATRAAVAKAGAGGGVPGGPGIEGHHPSGAPRKLRRDVVFMFCAHKVLHAAFPCRCVVCLSLKTGHWTQGMPARNVCLEWHPGPDPALIHSPDISIHIHLGVTACGAPAP